MDDRRPLVGDDLCGLFSHEAFPAGTGRSTNTTRPLDRKVKDDAFVLLPVIMADRAKGPAVSLPDRFCPRSRLNISARIGARAATGIMQLEREGLRRRTCAYLRTSFHANPIRKPAAGFAGPNPICPATQSVSYGGTVGLGAWSQRPSLRCAQAPTTLEAAQEAGLHGRNGPGWRNAP